MAWTRRAPLALLIPGKLGRGKEHSPDRRRRRENLAPAACPPQFDARLPPERALAVLRHLADGCGARQTGRLVGVEKDTVVRYGRWAGAPADQLHDELVAFSPADDQGAAG